MVEQKLVTEAHNYSAVLKRSKVKYLAANTNRTSMAVHNPPLQVAPAKGGVPLPETPIVYVSHIADPVGAYSATIKPGGYYNAADPTLALYLWADESEVNVSIRIEVTS